MKRRRRFDEHRTTVGGENRVDRVYRKGLPALRTKLERLRDGFSRVDSRTDWAKLRIEPLMAHARSLERVLGSGEFSQESSRLRRGVVMFHSDLVYLRTNVQALEKILRSEQEVLARQTKRKGNREA